MENGAPGGGKGGGALSLWVWALLWAAAGVAVYLVFASRVSGRASLWLLAWGLAGLAGAWFLWARPQSGATSSQAPAPADAAGPDVDAAPVIPRAIRHLRRAALEGGRVLDATTYLATWQLFEGCAKEDDLLAAVRALVPDYGREEFLLPVDAAGAPVYPPEGVLLDYRRRLARRPGLAGWLREETLDERPVLLAARWLCHLAGLRHRAVLIVLDHPSRADLVLMQVRSPNKLESPGCFDLPVAGHVPGLSTPEAALSAEMAQELGLRSEDVSDVRLLSAYDAPPGDPAAPRCNAEYRLVYRGRAAQGLAERVWFSDGEVAALAIFSRAELRALVATQPERVAPGLAESLPLFAGDAASEIES